MAGCGTVAVETTFAGKAGLFSDIDPLACLLTRAKARPVDPDWLVNTVASVLKESKPFAKPGVKRANALKYIHNLEDSTPFRAPQTCSIGSNHTLPSTYAKCYSK